MKKFLALVLALVCLLSLFVGCGKEESAEVVLPVQNVEETYENRYKALEETAMAYWRKGINVQYDDQAFCVLGRSQGLRSSQETFNTPEYASDDHIVFNVCATYVYNCLWHTFGYRMRGSTHGATQMAILATGDMQEDEMVYHIVNDPENPKKAVEDMNKLFEMIQPGDVINYERDPLINTVGHTVIWTRDLNGDGTEDMLNVDSSGGGHYDGSLGIEKREPNGGVFINTDRFKVDGAHDFFGNPVMYDYIPKWHEYCVIRLPDPKQAEKYPITEEAKTRLLYPGMDIYYTADTRFYGAVTKGEEVTYTLTIKNNSQQKYEGLLIQIPVAENATLTKINGNAAKGKLIKLAVDIPAGQTANITYTLKATGEVGSRIFTAGGYVHAIPLPEIYTVIRSGEVDGAAVKAAAEKHTDKSGMEFANAVYADLGKTLDLPADLKSLQDDLFKETRVGDYKVWTPAETYENATLANMQIPDFFGGKYVLTPMDSRRVNQIRTYDMEPGDLLIWEELKGDCQVAVFDGENLLRCTHDGKLVPLTQEDMDRFLIYRFFIALRPTQAL